MMNLMRKSMAKNLLHGVLLLDKPQGLTSQQAVSRVKWLFNCKKAGHTGTLDPMATGLLPICLGEATKFSHYQLDANKSYQAIIELGSQTDTGDAEGQVIAHQAVPQINPEQLNQVSQQFMGKQQQIPPMYSALKQHGKKLYELAREGITVERAARDIHIFQLTIAQLTATQLNIEVTCSKGTYIRVLAEDIANALSTCGHLSMLRRSQVGWFKLANAISLDELNHLTLLQRQTHLLPLNACVTHLPQIELSSEHAKRIGFGQRLNVFEQAKQLGINRPTDVQLFFDGLFLGLGILEPSGRLQPKKLVQHT